MVWDFNYGVPRWHGLPRHLAGRSRFGGGGMGPRRRWQTNCSATGRRFQRPGRCKVMLPWRRSARVFLTQRSYGSGQRGTGKLRNTPAIQRSGRCGCARPRSWKPKPTVLNYTCFRPPFSTFPIRIRKKQVRIFPYQSFDCGLLARNMKTETPQIWGRFDVRTVAFDVPIRQLFAPSPAVARSRTWCQS